MQRFSKKHLKSRGKTANLIPSIAEVARKENRDTLMGMKIEGKSRVKS